MRSWPFCCLLSPRIGNSQLLCVLVRLRHHAVQGSTYNWDCQPVYGKVLIHITRALAVRAERERLTSGTGARGLRVAGGTMVHFSIGYSVHRYVVPCIHTSTYMYMYKLVQVFVHTSTYICIVS